MCAHDELAASAACARGARGVPAVWSRTGKLHLLDVTLGLTLISMCYLTIAAFTARLDFEDEIQANCNEFLHKHA